MRLEPHGSGEFWDMLNSEPLRAAEPLTSMRSRARSGSTADHDPLATRPSAHGRDLRAVRVQPAQHPRRLADRRCARDAKGRLSGLRAHHDRARAAARHAVPLRQRLPVSAAATDDCARSTARRTPGSRRCCQSSAGSASIRPTTWWPAIGTSAWRSAATTPTCRRPAVSSRASARSAASWRSASGSARHWPASPETRRHSCRGCHGTRLRRSAPPISRNSNSNSHDVS